MTRHPALHTFLALRLFAAAAVLLLLASCHADRTAFVISEVIPTNKTGLLASDGEPHDWIEIHNTSSHSANLKGFILVKDSSDVTWTFPDTTLQANARIIVFATKKQLKSDLSCGFKLSGKDGAVRLLNKRRVEVSCADYKGIDPDQALKLTKKGKYKKTFESTPLFPNDDEGRAEAVSFIEKQRRGPLRIWEYMSKSESPWVEVKNISQAPVSLAGYVITSDKKDQTATSADSTSKASPAQLPLPDRQLAPGDIILIKDADRLLKDEIAVLRHNGKFADGACAHDTYYGISIGRRKDKSGLFYFATPTPGTENTAPAFAEIAKAPKFATQPGVYKDSTLDVTLEAKGNAVIHYTLDGTQPTASSPCYSKPIHIKATTTVRAISIDSTRLTSPVATGTYLLGIHHTLPVFNITVNPADLFSESSGIYAEGPNAAPVFPHYGANYWKHWEKPAHIEFFDGHDGFSHDCGIRIFGAFSRFRPKKSFTIRFRERYGKKNIRYDLYADGHHDKYKAFVLRSGSQDDQGVMARDEFFTSLFAQQSPTLHVQRYRPAVLYINGEYWGLYYIREKVDEHFVANHLGVKPSTASLIEGIGTAKCGTIADYTTVKNYVTTHNLREDKAYDYVASKIDIQSLIDYKIGEFYSGNQDVGNIRYFRSTDPDCNQKWHWLYYDLDWGFYYSTSLHYYISAGATRASGLPIAPFNIILDRILQNPRGRALFLQRWAHHMAHTIEPQHALKVFDHIIAAIQPEMERNCQRWPQMSYKKWQKNVEDFREKIKARPAALHQDVLRELNVTQKEKQQYFKK